MNEEQPTTGARGCAITPMMPSGKVLIDGIKYSARMKSGSAESGDEVVVVGHGFGLIVEQPDSLVQAPQSDPNGPNEDILRVFQELPDHRKSDLQSLIDEYHSACRQSQGSQPHQSAYWKKKVSDLEHDLRKQLDLD